MEGDQVAWIALIGTLGGVLITASFSLVSTYLSHRWQERLSQHDDALEFRRSLRSDRRQKYAEYIVSASNVFDLAYRDYVLNRQEPIDRTEYALNPPKDVIAASIRNESLRIEVLLLAGEEVTDALHEYDAWLKKFYPTTGSGAEILDRPKGNQLYKRLVLSMRREVSTQAGFK